MNNFKTTDLGGLPYVLDDVRFQQNATKEAFKALISSLELTENEPIILSGCEVIDIGSFLSVASGYIVIDGELFTVDTHVVPKALGLNKNYFDIVVTYDPAGNKTFDNGSNFDTHEIRRAQIVFNSFLPFNRVEWNETRRLNEWTIIDLEGSTDVVVNNNINGSGTEAALLTAPNAQSKLRYKIDGKLVHISVSIEGIEVPNFSTIEARTIKLKNLPFNFANYVEFGAYHARGVNGNLNGVNEVFHTSLTDEICFRLAHLGGNFGVFNRYYQFQPAPAMNVQTTADVTSTHIWALFGTFTFALS